MAARRMYTIECDGPTCNKVVYTDERFVRPARDAAMLHGWFETHEGTAPGGVDFCSEECKKAYEALKPPDRF